MTVTAPDNPNSDNAADSYDDLLAELRSWLDQNWDPDLAVGEWWERLGLAGWAAPIWPEQWYGRGLSRDEANVISREISSFGALNAPSGLGLLLAGPTIVAHGTDDQRSRFLPDIVTGKKAWCQLFSEPGAGSDLAGLQAKAMRDGDEWIVNGQKVWTSGAQGADLGMLLTRTDADVPKHRGITYFALDMMQPGVDIRPLREMTGRALVQRSLHDGLPRRRCRPDRWAQQRLGRGQHHAGERTSRAGRGRGRCVRGCLPGPEGRFPRAAGR